MNLSRRQLLAGASASAAATVLSHPRMAASETTLDSNPLPGVVRQWIGSSQVTALLDGYMEMPADLFSIPSSEAEELLVRAFKEDQPNLSPVNAFLLNLGEHLVLIDTGAANSFGPTLGKLPEALEAHGVSADQIDAVLLTHLHPDHIAGAIDDTGSAVFPNAELIVPETEFRYWHDDAAVAAPCRQSLRNTDDSNQP